MPNISAEAVELPRSPPAARKSLKRSASVASLPTPPRTRQDRSRRRSSRSSAFSDESTEEELSDAEAEPSAKRRKLEAEEEEEDIFWMGGATTSSSRKTQRPIATAAASSSKRKSADRDSELSSPASPDLAPHLLRKSQALASGVSSLASPPPSRRPRPAKSVTEDKEKTAEKGASAKAGKATGLKSPPQPALALPLTPQKTRKRMEKRGFLLSRDSPDNPFLDDGKGDDLPEKLVPTEEKPTMTYVFRGKRTEFANPHYTPPTRSSKRQKQAPAPHELPITHPDYSPDMRCPPKRLFAKPRRVAPLPKRAARLSSSSGDNDEEDDVDTVEAPIARQLFKSSKSTAKQGASPSSS